MFRPVVFALLLLLGFGLAPFPSGMADPAKQSTSAWGRKLSLAINGQERWYRVFAPKRDMSGRPVVLLLHGGGSGMNQVVSKKGGAARGWLEVARRENFLLLVPNGVNPWTGDAGGNHQHWSDLRGESASIYTGADDVAFLHRLVEWAHENFRTDPARVYVTGASNGGLMTYTMLIRYPGMFAAGAAFIANLPKGQALPEGRRHPVPVLIASGTEDPLMKFGGGAVPLGRGTVMSARETVEWWIAANGADTKGASTHELPDVQSGDGCRIRETVYPARGPASAPVYLYVMKGGGHAAPSAKYTQYYRRFIGWLLGPQCRDAEAAELAWDFFRRFGR